MFWRKKMDLMPTVDFVSFIYYFIKIKIRIIHLNKLKIVLITNKYNIILIRYRAVVRK